VSRPVPGVTIASAASIEQARRLLVGATPPKIDRALRLGMRKPAWTWFATASSGDVLGVVAGWGSAGRRTAAILDFLDLPEDPEVTAALFEAAAAESWEPGRDSLEIIHFLSNESPDDDPQLVVFVSSLAASGFRRLVRRHRYRMPVQSTAVTIPDTRLRFEPLTGEDDPRLPAIVAEILVGSLDAHDVAALERARHSVARGANPDFAAVAKELTQELLESDPVDSFFLAIDPGHEIIGLVVGGLRGTPDIGVASFIGVSHRHRGRGYAAQLLGWMTARLIARNAQTLIGETDDDNFPMDAAFRLVGYPHSESRIDFVRDLDPVPPVRSASP
jgi:GNAT superfamily N-acetyltransferase